MKVVITYLTHLFLIYIAMRYFAISLCLLVVGCAAFFDFNLAPTVTTSPQFHVVLDAGHGGRDNGACVAGVSEAQINLQIVQVLAQELTAQGLKVSLTRVDAESLNSPYASNKKVDDMNKRRAKIRELNPDLVIAIHQNTYPLTSVSGLQCFYANETAGSREYATAIQDQFNHSALPMYKTVKPTDFNLVEHSPCPAVLIECGFLTNPRERQLLQTAAYQQVLAFNISTAVVRMMKQGGNERCANVQPLAMCSVLS